ncbi:MULTISPECIES: DUF397 domain-containing protein [unclassified Streptomyces]|uniref:DUF397 domain-containing protein n=1 Tax=unclassified Streptomyces TaxID=2593676 RepID=UPI00267DB8C0
MNTEGARTDNLNTPAAMAYDLSGVQWTKSSYSGGGGSGDCVEYASVGGAVAVRDSKNPEGGKLFLGVQQFAGLVAMAKGAQL